MTAARDKPGMMPSMTFVLAAAFIAFGAWASFFEIDQTVLAQGQVIPVARTQVIQAVDGGVLSEIRVREGEAVKAGQVLAVLDKDRTDAAYQETRSRLLAIKAALVRAAAEVEGKTPVFGKEFDSFPEFVSGQMAFFEQRRKSLNETVGALKKSLDMAREELRVNESLLKTGDVSQLEVIRSRRQVADLEGRVLEIRNKYFQESRQEIAKLEEELASSRYKLEDRQSVLQHTELTAPVDGVVKYLRVNTLGGVLRAGDELMQISPTESKLVVEVRLNPADIGQLKLGLPVTIRLDAFDYTIYGTLRGELSYISSDTLAEQGPAGQTMVYYRAQVTVADSSANPKLDVSKLKPGMMAQAHIRTNTRTVLQYLLKPIIKSVSGALGER